MPTVLSSVSRQGRVVSMQGMRYRLVVDGELGPRYAKAFEGMDVESHNGVTVICGTIADQAHLHGVLNKIEDLGIKLVSIGPDHGER